jgi:polyketide biosynthesis acyl carrier protein
VTREDVFTVLKNSIIDVVPDVSAKDIDRNAQLKDLGANSVDRVKIIINTMESLEIKIPLVEFSDKKNIEQLITFFHQKKAG